MLATLYDGVVTSHHIYQLIGGFPAIPGGGDSTSHFELWIAGYSRLWRADSISDIEIYGLLAFPGGGVVTQPQILEIFGLLAIPGSGVVTQLQI